MKDTESKIAAILTPEQKARLEELRKQQEANHEKFDRGGFPGKRDQGASPAQKPSGPPQP